MDNKSRVLFNNEEKVQHETDSLHGEKQLQQYFMKQWVGKRFLR
jgi:hypothetical protein